MTDAFISYAREDRRFVQRLHDALASGRGAWVDTTASSTLVDNLDHTRTPLVHDVLYALHDRVLRPRWDGPRDNVGQKARQMFADAGFRSVEAKHVDGDIFNTYYVAMRS